MSGERPIDKRLTLSPSEIEAIYGIPTSTVATLVRRGDLQAFRYGRGRGRLRIFVSSLEEHIARRAVAPQDGSQ